jgi:energy-coupling factor transport system permease protein
MAPNFYNIPESIIEKLHPLSKMLFLLIIILATLLADSLIQAAVISAIIILYISTARLLIRILPFIAFYLFSSSALLGLLYLISGSSVHVETALLIFTKFFSNIFCGLVLAFTTPPRKMASALKQLRLPQSILFIFILALRLFPVIIKEYQYILDSVRLRNLSIVRVLLFQPQLVIFPILVRSVKLSDELALSAETRGFSMQNIQLPSYRLRFTLIDFAFIIGIIFVITFLLTNELGL